MARGLKGKISKSSEKVVAKAVRKFYHGEQHSGRKPKHGAQRKAQSKAQALAIGYSEARKGKK
jgi:hypothetical protein